MKEPQQKFGMTKQILIAMAIGITLGLSINLLPSLPFIDEYFVNGLLDFGGKAFINALKMLVVPIVFVSLVCGTFNLDKSLSIGRIAIKTIALYMLTTAIAISLALMVANLFDIGSDLVPSNVASQFSVDKAPSLKQTLLNIFPSNPFKAMAEGNMLQIIVFALLLGIAITWSGANGDRIKLFFTDLDVVVMNLVNLVIRITPYGVFCLVTKVFASNGLPLFIELGGYFATVIFALFLHLFLTYGAFINFFARLNPLPFFKKMVPAQLFAFSTSSSNASIPVVLNTVEKKLGVKESIASFVIPLGATVNMDGTAIMQGVATVFIANAYHIHLSLGAFLKVILTATLASIGTAGIPSMGLITLMMVLMQVGLPVEGIALIVGIDRLLDMIRTAVNVTGDAMVAFVVAKKEKQLDLGIYEGEVRA